MQLAILAPTAPEKNLSTPLDLRQEATYFVKSQIVSPATRVVFTSSISSPFIPLCLKMWQPCNNGVYITEDVAKEDALDLKKCRDYLVEGWNFNIQFAADVYLGFFQILNEDVNGEWITCSPLITIPTRLKPDKSYALVMRDLRQEWRLDQQVYSKTFCGYAGIKFLALEVAHMHKRLKRGGKHKGSAEQIRAKLKLNIQQFEQALEKLATDSIFRSISALMNKTYKAYKPYFEQRCKDGSIKRCHGDLKTVNLWLCPKDFSSSLKEPSDMRSWQLIALDCVDFNEDFCHIDTLSDVAMLAMDLEMRLTQRLGHQCGKRLVGTFLDTYLREMKDTSEMARLLLEYYITEKAMVCAYMSILYDGLPSLGNQYLAIALAHARKLEANLKPVNLVSVSVEPLQEARKIPLSHPLDALRRLIRGRHGRLLRVYV